MDTFVHWMARLSKYASYLNRLLVVGIYFYGADIRVYIFHLNFSKWYPYRADLTYFYVAVNGKLFSTLKFL
jgi:hypothetical protein